MGRYFFALIRCVPSPRTGEFINMGAVAGDPDSGDWSVREIGNEQRVRSLAEIEDMTAVHDLIARIGFQIDSMETLLGATNDEVLDLDWLSKMHNNYRNVVQVSRPSIMIAESAEAALDIIFEHYLIDPARAVTQGNATKSAAVAALRSSYRAAGLNPAYVKSGVDVVVDDDLVSHLDFVIGNGQAVQLSQGWSFQVGRVEYIGDQVKSWAYALNSLRRGASAKSASSRGDHRRGMSPVLSTVELEVVILEPITQTQEKVYTEASKVFADLQANVVSISQARAVGSRAAALLRSHPGQEQLD